MKFSNVFKRIGCVLFAIISVFSLYLVILTDKLPSDMFIKSGSTKTLDISFPFLYEINSETQGVISVEGETLADKLEICSEAEGKTQLTFDLFGLIPVKDISVTVGEERMLVPGGQSIGVMLYTDGALVIASGDIQLEDGTTVNPGAQAGIMPGDIIKSINGVAVQNARHLTQLINQSEQSTLVLGIERSDKSLTLPITPVKDSYDGSLRLGLWVRDSTAGVGTLTYLDPATKQFGGLGHAITDIDTATALSVKNGEVIFSDIYAIEKSEQGSPGALKGTFDPSENVFGYINENTELGLFGDYIPEEAPQNIGAIPAASTDEVHTGGATLLCSIDSEGVKEYTCKVVSVHHQSHPEQKGFIIEVTDERLLNATGGIAQGMSGSPIIQDGKLIGAVTHVIINEPKKGYCVYIDWMLYEMEN